MAGLLRARQAPGPGRSPSLILPGTPGGGGRGHGGPGYKTLPARGTSGIMRDKVRPARGLHRCFREKTRPAQPLLRCFREKLAQHATNRRFWAVLNSQGELFRAHTHQQTKQGELCTARGAGDGTKLSRLAASASPTGTKLSQHARNTHFRRILRQQGEFCIAFTTNTPHREKKVTHQHAPRPTNAPLPQFRMQFDCMKLQQCSETLQFQRSQFKS